MEITIRSATEADAQACGRICYEGFRAVTDRHGYPPVFGSIEVATRRLAAFLANPSVFGLVAELEGKRRIAGFNFLSERDPVRAIGPIAVDPSLHGYGIGRRLMQAALDRARGAPSVRLVQESYNIQSLSLYASLGFDAREVYAVVTGTPGSGRAPAGLGGSPPARRRYSGLRVAAAACARLFPNQRAARNLGGRRPLGGIARRTSARLCQRAHQLAGESRHGRDGRRPPSAAARSGTKPAGVVSAADPGAPCGAVPLVLGTRPARRPAYDADECRKIPGAAGSLRSFGALLTRFQGM